MATLKYFAFSLCILCIGMGSLHSQTVTSKNLDLRAYRTRQILEAIKEKMHLPKGVVSGMKNDEESTLSVPYDSNEKISTSYPESEVHAAINPTDSANIVLGPIHLNNGMTLPIYYTTNFGQKWSKSTFQPEPYDPSALISGGGDPVFAYDASGTVYMSWIDTYGSFTLVPGEYVDSVLYGMYWAYSTDMGKSWQRTVNGYIGNGAEVILIDSATGVETLASNSGFDDKEWIAVDRSSSQYRNSLYVAWTHLGTTSSNVMVRRKIPGVDSMQPAVKASSDAFASVQYTSLGIDAKGGLHVTFLGTYDTSNYGIYTVYSSDGGATFGPAVKISDADIPTRSADAISDGYTIYGIRQQGNYPCAHLSIDTAGEFGTLYETWCAIGVEADSGFGSEIYFSRSTDNGTTWSNPNIINNDLDSEIGQIDHFYPSIAVNGKGMISVGWYDRREDPINNTVGRYYIGQSTDQGRTWTNAPVATQPMDFSDVMNVNQNFGIGEYTQVLTTSSYTIPVWSDGRDNQGELRVYAAFLNPANAGVTRLSSISEGLELSTNYPNPFRSTTNFSFTQETSAHAELYVTNVTGQRVASIYNGMAEAGEHDFTFDGSKLANGVYYLNLESDLGIVRQAMTILR